LASDEEDPRSVKIRKTLLGGLLGGGLGAGVGALSNARTFSDEFLQAQAQESIKNIQSAEALGRASGKVLGMDELANSLQKNPEARRVFFEALGGVPAASAPAAPAKSPSFLKRLFSGAGSAEK